MLLPDDIRRVMFRCLVATTSAQLFVDLERSKEIGVTTVLLLTFLFQVAIAR